MVAITQNVDLETSICGLATTGEYLNISNVKPDACMRLSKLFIIVYVQYIICIISISTLSMKPSLVSFVMLYALVDFHVSFLPGAWYTEEQQNYPEPKNNESHGTRPCKHSNVMLQTDVVMKSIQNTISKLKNRAFYSAVVVVAKVSALVVVC